jgi:hypothetical protein
MDDPAIYGPRLAGLEAEREFCGPLDDGSDRVDYEMAREYLARRIPNPLQAAAELARYGDAAQRLVRSAWAQRRIVISPPLCCETGR